MITNSLKIYCKDFCYKFRNLNIKDEPQNDGTYVTEHQTTYYKGKLRYKERNFTIDYGNVWKYLKEIEKRKNNCGSDKMSEFTKKASCTSKITAIEFRAEEEMKGFMIRVGTPIKEIRDKDLPSP